MAALGLDGGRFEYFPMTNEYFSRFAKVRLGAAVFDPATVLDTLPAFQASLASFEHHCRWADGAVNARGEAFDLVAGFVDVYQPNALADQHDTRHAIAVHSPLFSAFNEFAMFCFAQAGVFPECGDRGSEISPSPWDDRVPGVWLMDATAQQERVDEHHSQALIPRCPERFVASQYLTLLMLRMVWLHEFAHCFNGHVGLVQDRRLALRLYELPPRNLVEIGNAPVADHDRLLKCLEFDADTAAFQAMCNIQLNGQENIEGISALGTAFATQLSIFASYAVVWLMDAFQSYLDSHAGHGHPPPSLRLQNMLQVAEAQLFPLGLRADHDATLAAFSPLKQAIPNMFTQGTLRDMAHSEADRRVLQGFEADKENMQAALADYRFQA